MTEHSWHWPQLVLHGHRMLYIDVQLVQCEPEPIKLYTCYAYTVSEKDGELL